MPNIYSIKIHDAPAGHISRLAPCYAWKWHREDGEYADTFDCGLTATDVGECIAHKTRHDPSAVTVEVFET